MKFTRDESELRRFDDWILRCMAEHPFLFDLVVVGAMLIIILGLWFAGVEFAAYKGE